MVKWVCPGISLTMSNVCQDEVTANSDESLTVLNLSDGKFFKHFNLYDYRSHIAVVRLFVSHANRLNNQIDPNKRTNTYFSFLH